MSLLKKRMNITAAIVATALILISFYFLTREPPVRQGTKNIVVEVVHSDLSVREFQFQTGEEYLAPALTGSGIATGDETSYGLFITEVDGERAEIEKEEWWCITKDREVILSGADEITVADGDRFELTFTVGWQG